MKNDNFVNKHHRLKLINAVSGKNNVTQQWIMQKLVYTNAVEILSLTFYYTALNVFKATNTLTPLTSVTFKFYVLHYISKCTRYLDLYSKCATHINASVKNKIIIMDTFF